MGEDVLVRPLTPSSLEDYLAFFDGPAFADNPRWASCYCFFHHNPDPATWDSRSGRQNRSAVADLIRLDRFHGFLAFRGGSPIGWCNAAPRLEIPALARLPELDGEDADRVGSIVCFVVAEEHRGGGVARALLDGACRSFAERSLSIAEAYPRTDAAGAAANYHGPIQLYQAMGFTSYREFDGWAVVRKAL